MSETGRTPSPEKGPYVDAAREWFMLPINLGHLQARDGMMVRPRQIFGGKRWSVSFIRVLRTAQESDLATRKGPT